MWMLPPTVQIMFCLTPVDMRRSFDSLAEIVRSDLGDDPLSGHLFIFRNKAEDSVKLLYWDRDGYAIWYKRLQKGSFALPSGTSAGLQIDAALFSMLLNGLDMKRVKRQKRYTREEMTV